MNAMRPVMARANGHASTNARRGGAQRLANGIPQPAAQVLSRAPASLPPLRRSCACGGACPRCRGATATTDVARGLKIGGIDDPLEREADHVADEVLRMPDRAPPASQERGGDAALEVSRASESSSAAAGPGDAPAVVGRVLASPGQSMDAGDRAYFEPRFRRDFTDVRIHADELAAASARAVGARAYAVGNHIVLGQGESTRSAVMAHELAHVVQHQFATPILRRYSHEDCTEDDLKNHIWPADYLARQMVKKAIRVLSSPAIDSSVIPLLNKYFMTSSPSPAALLKVFDKIDAEFRANDYTYECEDDCGGEELGYVWGLWSDIHLCMNHLRGKANECIARTMVHEFSHYYAGTDDNAYCKSGCSYDSCPSSLSAAQALENADSYACFAYELWSLSV